MQKFSAYLTVSASDLKCQRLSHAMARPLLDQGTTGLAATAPLPRSSHQTLILSMPLAYFHPFSTWLSYPI